MVEQRRKEINFPEQQIQSADALTEMSQGHWEGCPRSEMYTPDILNLVERLQPDFAAPSGESLRQVEFRMVQFLNGSLLVLPEKLRSDFFSPRPNDGEFVNQNSHPYINDRDVQSFPAPQWDLLYRHRQLSREKQAAGGYYNRR